MHRKAPSSRVSTTLARLSISGCVARDFYSFYSEPETKCYRDIAFVFLSRGSRSWASGIYVSNYTLSTLNDDHLTISPSRTGGSRGGSCSGEVTMRYVRTGEINAHLEIGRLWQCWEPGCMPAYTRTNLCIQS